MKTKNAERIIITTVSGDEYTFSGNRAEDLYKAYKGAVENDAPWIYTNDDNTTSVFQIQHIVNIHVIYGGDSNA